MKLKWLFIFIILVLYTNVMCQDLRLSANFTQPEIENVDSWKICWDNDSLEVLTTDSVVTIENDSIITVNMGYLFSYEIAYFFYVTSFNSSGSATSDTVSVFFTQKKADVIRVTEE